MNNVAQVKARPTLLTVICILTFIGSGLSALLYLIAAVAFGAISGLLDSIPGMSAIIGGGAIFFVVSLILAAVSLFGAIKMWGLKKMGFYLYAVAQVLMLVVPFIFITGATFSIFGFIFTALFIALYAVNLKLMD